MAFGSESSGLESSFSSDWVGTSAKVGAGRTAARGAGGWGLLAAKQLHDDGADDTDLEDEGFEDIPF
jgi:hypothetical protein